MLEIVMKIDIEQINREESMSYAYLTVCDSFSITWLCSHYRVVSMRPSKDISVQEFLVWVLRRDPAHPQLELKDWLPNCVLREVGTEEILRYIKHAESDLAEGKSESNSEIEDVMFPLSGAETSNIKCAYFLEGVKNPCNKHGAGPTYIHVWINGEDFHYLEVHNES